MVFAYMNNMSIGVNLVPNLGFRSSRRLRASNCQERSVLELQNEPSSTAENSGNLTNDNVSIPDSQDVQKHRLPPLVNALKVSAEQNFASFQFPGHNSGKAAPSSLIQLIGNKPFIHDVSDLPELGSLFSLEGPIAEAQREAAQLFGASETWFLVGGTTCGVQAAIMATCSPGDTLILARNSHKSAISAMVLSDVIPKYIIPEYDFDWDITGEITKAQVEKAIKELKMQGRKAAAVFVTSPTYHGVCSNLNEISVLCHSHSIPLIVDEAHGAHFGFHPELPSSSLCQGADIAVQSTHKVLCSLTQSSMLHMSGNIVNRERICQCLQTLQTSSPSILLLSSLDAARAELSENRHAIFDRAIKLAAEAKTMISNIPGISVLDHFSSSSSSYSSLDPMRVTIGVWELGMSGFEADDILYKEYDILSELAGTRSITFVITLGSSGEDMQRLVIGLRRLSETLFPTRGTKDNYDNFKHYESLEDIRMSLNPREAFFASKRKVSVKNSLGEISGELICPYPPGIPLLIPGEIITKPALDYLLQVRSRGGVIDGASDPCLSSIFVCNS